MNALFATYLGGSVVTFVATLTMVSVKRARLYRNTTASVTEEDLLTAAVYALAWPLVILGKISKRISNAILRAGSQRK